MTPSGKILTKALDTDDSRTAIIEAEKFLAKIEEEKLGAYRLSELPEMWLRANSKKSKWYRKDIDKCWKLFIQFFENCYAQKITTDDMDNYKRYIETSYITKHGDKLSRQRSFLFFKPFRFNSSSFDYRLDGTRKSTFAKLGMIFMPPIKVQKMSVVNRKERSFKKLNERSNLQIDYFKNMAF